MKTKLIAVFCLCAVMLFASSISATGDRLTAEPQHGQEKIGIPRTGAPYEVPAGYPNFEPLDGRAILLSEDFEAGMPAGWTVVDGNSDGYTWTVGTTSDLLGYDPPAYGTAYAYYSDDDPGYTGGPHTEYLIAPAVECASYSNINFSFGWGFAAYDPPYGAVYARFHDGVSWGSYNLLATYSITANGISNFTLAGYLPADSVQVQFTYEDLVDGWGWGFGIDNVLLEVPPEHDVGCSEVTGPPAGSLTPGFYDVIGTIENFGLNSETFDVTANVYDTDGMVNLFSQTQSVTLASGANTSVNFGSLDFEIQKYFLTEIYTQLAGDEDLSNDTASVESRTALGLGDVVFELDVETIVGDNQLLGVEFDGEYFYVSGGNTGLDPNKIYVIDTFGTLVYALDQPAFSSGWGWGGLCWDGAVDGTRIDSLYGVTVYGYYADKFGIDKTAGTLNYYSSFPVPAYYSLGMAYDDDTDEFFGGNFFSSYGALRFLRNGSYTGWVSTTYALFGAAYDTDDEEGGLVYWFSQDDPGTGDLCQVCVMDATTMAWTGVVPNNPVITVSVDPIAGGCCFYEGFRDMDVLFGLVQGTPDAIVGMFVRYDVGPIEATIDFDPDNLTFLRKVQCYIELEAGYDVGDIDINTVAITKIDTLEIDPINAYRWFTHIGDHNDNGIPDLRVRFGRWEVWMALMNAGATGPTELTVTGLLDDGSEFEGVGTVSVFKPWWWWWTDGDQGYAGIPRAFGLNESQPNPFNSSTVISYAVPEPTNVELRIYDTSGRLVKSLVNNSVAPGYYNVRWDAKDDRGKDVASGVYFLKFNAGTYTADSKLVLVK